MKLLGLSLIAASLAFGSAASAADLKISLSNFRNDKGLVRIVVYGEAEAAYYLKDDKESTRAEWSKSLPVKDAHEITVHGLKPGRFAIAVIHDENSNGKLDRTLGFGPPKEGYGFSVSTSIMPPKFNAAAFSVKDPSTSISIKLTQVLR